MHFWRYFECQSWLLGALAPPYGYASAKMSPRCRHEMQPSTRIQHLLMLKLNFDRKSTFARVVATDDTLGPFVLTRDSRHFFSALGNRDKRQTDGRRTSIIHNAVYQDGRTVKFAATYWACPMCHDDIVALSVERVLVASVTSVIRSRMIAWPQLPPPFLSPTPPRFPSDLMRTCMHACNDKGWLAYDRVSV